MPLFTPQPIPWDLGLGDYGLASENPLVANIAYYSGVTLPTSATLTALRVAFGSAGVGNYDVGIYDVNGNLLNNKGAAISTTGVLTYTLGTALALSPGRYWLAFWIDNATDVVASRTGFTGLDVCRTVTATTNLPATMSGAVNSSTKVYVQGLLSGAWS